MEELRTYFNVKSGNIVILTTPSASKKQRLQIEPIIKPLPFLQSGTGNSYHINDIHYSTITNKFYMSGNCNYNSNYLCVSNMPDVADSFSWTTFSVDNEYIIIDNHSMNKVLGVAIKRSTNTLTTFDITDPENITQIAEFSTTYNLGYYEDERNYTYVDSEDKFYIAFRINYSTYATLSTTDYSYYDVDMPTSMEDFLNIKRQSAPKDSSGNPIRCYFDLPDGENLDNVYQAGNSYNINIEKGGVLTKRAINIPSQLSNNYPSCVTSLYSELSTIYIDRYNLAVNAMNNGLLWTTDYNTNVVTENFSDLATANSVEDNLSPSIMEYGNGYLMYVPCIGLTDAVRTPEMVIYQFI